MPQQAPAQPGERRTFPEGIGEWDGTNWVLVGVQSGGGSGGSGGRAGAPDDNSALFGLLNTIGSGGKNLLEGIGKGATHTVAEAGKMMSSPATDWLGNKAAEGAGALGLGPDVSQTASAAGAHGLSAFDDATKPEGAMQKIGRGGEQIGEYFIGAGPARKLAVEGFARAIPNSLGRQGMAVGNKLAAILGRTAGEGANAAATSTLHGETNPDSEAGIAAVGPAARAGTEAALGNSAVQQLLAILGAGAPAGLSIGGTGGLASRMGTFGLLKRLLTDQIGKPGFRRGVGAAVGGGVRAGAGLQEQRRQTNQTR